MSDSGRVIVRGGAHAVKVTGHGDVVEVYLLASPDRRTRRRLIHHGQPDIGTRRADDRVGGLRTWRPARPDVARQVDHDGFADPERKRARIHLSVAGGDGWGRTQAGTLRDSCSLPPCVGAGLIVSAVTAENGCGKDDLSPYYLADFPAVHMRAIFSTIVRSTATGGRWQGTTLCLLRCRWNAVGYRIDGWPAIA